MVQRVSLVQNPALAVSACGHGGKGKNKASHCQFLLSFLNAGIKAVHSIYSRRGWTMDLNNDIKTFSVLFGIPFLAFPNILPLFWAPSWCFTDYLGLIPRSFPRIYQLILYVITFLHVMLGLFFETVSPMTSLLSALNSTCHFTAQLLIALLWFSTLCLCLHYLKWLRTIHRLHCLAVASLC